MELDQIYTSLDDAREEIKRRWEDKELRKKVEDFLGNDIPEFLLDSPKAYLARHIGSPNFEFLLFEDLTNKVGLEFVLSEYTDDIFVPENSLKYHLAKMFFKTKIGKKQTEIITTDMIVDFNKSNGKRLKEINTIKGEGIVDFHHRLLRKHEKNIHYKIYDFSNWLKKFGQDPGVFYYHFLAFFIRNGILFENFLLNEEEKKFTTENVIPNFIKLTEKFGVRPLIVRLLPKEKEEDIHWLCYPEVYKDKI